MTDVTIHTVPFQLNNATGNQTITDPNPTGDTPKAALFIFSSATGTGTITDVARASWGMTDGTTHLVTGYMAEENALAANADTGRRVDDATVIQITATTSQVLDYEGAWVSFGTDAVTISNSAARQYQGFVVLFYGSDLGAFVVAHTSSATVGVQTDINGASFAPDCVIAFSAMSAFVADTGLNNAIQSFGFAGRLPSTTNACMGVAAADLASPTSVGQIVRSDAILVRTTGVALTSWVDVTAWDSDGISVTLRNAPNAIAGAYLLLRVGGHKCVAKAPVLDVDGTGAHSYTDIGFKARAMMLVGTESPSLDTFDATISAHSVAGVDNVDSSTVGWNARDNLATSDTQCITYGSASGLAAVIGTASNFHWRAAFTAFTSTGFDYSVEAADSVDRACALLAIGEASPIFTETVTVSETIALVIGLPLSETETISETIAQVIDEALSETVTISETVDLISVSMVTELVIDETETIVESAYLFPGEERDFTETVNISETVDLLAQNAADSVFDETETISETFTLLISTNIFDVTDTVSISETAFLFLGQVIVSDDTVTISEDINYGAGLVAMKATKAGGVFQW